MRGQDVHIFVCCFSHLLLPIIVHLLFIDKSWFTSLKYILIHLNDLCFPIAKNWFPVFPSIVPDGRDITQHLLKYLHLCSQSSIPLNRRVAAYTPCQTFMSMIDGGSKRALSQVSSPGASGCPTEPHGWVCNKSRPFNQGNAPVTAKVRQDKGRSGVAVPNSIHVNLVEGRESKRSQRLGGQHRFKLSRLDN